MRDVMHRSGIFPLGGIRSEGRGSMSAVASGDAELAFIDMTLRMGTGRDEEVRVWSPKWSMPAPRTG